jgi:hypothetical protein
MNELETLKDFIDNSEFSEEIKTALFDFVILEKGKKTTHDYQQLVKVILEKHSDEG